MKKFIALLTKEKRPRINGKMTPKKLGQFFFDTVLANLFKQRYISSVTSYKYLNKLISEV